MKDATNNILSHTTWKCKYHIVFAPKYRRKIFYEEHRKEIMATIKELCRWKGVEIIEGEMAVDHVHILVEIPPKMSVSGFMEYLKGEEFVDNIPEMGIGEISIQMPRILVSWLLCRHDRQGYGNDKKVYTKPIETG